MAQDNQKNSSNSRPQGSSFPVGRGRGPGMMGAQGPAEKPKNLKNTLITLIHYMSNFRLLMLMAIFFALLSTAFTVVNPKILGNITNSVFDGYIKGRVYDQMMSSLPEDTVIPKGATGELILSQMPPDELSKIPEDRLDTIRTLDLSQRPEIDYDSILDSARIFILLFILSAFFGYLTGWIMSGISQKVTFNLRRDISYKMNRLPLSYFDKRTHGEILSRVTNDVDVVGQTLNQSLAQIVTSLTTIAGILAMMLTISWQMTLVAVIVLPVSIAIIGLVMSKSQSFFTKQQQSLGKINGHIEEMFSGHTIMKAFNGEKRSIAVFRGINEELYGSSWKAQFFSGLLMPIMTFVGNLGYVGVAVLGGYLAINGRVRIGDIQAFLQYMNQFTQPVMQTANIANVIQSTAAAAERVFEFLAEDEESLDITQGSPIKSIKGSVEFKDVVFGYSSEKTIIKNFSVNIKSGQKVAIVGPTGAGKTTIVNLLMRFYDTNSGSIKIDGIDIKDFRRGDLRSLFGMVLQDTWLFAGTIKENIGYGKKGASDKSIISAAKAAHADHFIRALPNGYNMTLNEEADNISQGEKQLLTIARAMLADAPILILDEATSSVDTRTEALIQRAMEKLMKGRTSFVIAHRLSTIKNADLILVMKDGNIAEQGTHDELIKKDGFYASLYNSQFKN